MQQHVGVIELGEHLFGIGDEIGREIAAVELHALDDLDVGLERLGLFDRDHAFIADLLHRLGDHLADRLVAVGGNGADLRHFRRRAHFLCALFDIGDDRIHREIDAALEIHRIHAGGNRLGAFLDDGRGKNRRGRGAVAGLVVGLRRHFAHHLRAHILELVLELDLLGDGDAVLGDAGSAEALLDHHVAAFRAERHPHRVGERLHAAQQAIAGVAGKTYFFCSHNNLLLENSCWRARFRRSRP